MQAPTSLIPPRALYIEVAELMRQRIYSRELAPGSWIDEMKIAEEFGISRTPLREALKVLAAEGLVTMKVRRGAYVTEVDSKDLEDIYSLLALLESEAAATVTEKATDEQIEALKAIHARLEQSTQSQNDFLRINEEFHFNILSIADNKWLLQVINDLRKILKLTRHQSLFKKGRIEASLQEHRDILQHIIARDANRARDAMKTHFKNSLNTF